MNGLPYYRKEFKGDMERLTISGTKEAKPDVTIREVLNKLAEYEDLEEQGKLLELPCAVGDTVYYSDNEYYFTVLPVKVDEIHLLINSKIPHYSNEKKNSCKRKIQEIMRKYDCDEDFIDTINDDFCRGFGTARDIIFEFLKEGYWKQREN